MARVLAIVLLLGGVVARADNAKSGPSADRAARSSASERAAPSVRTSAAGRTLGGVKLSGQVSYRGTPPARRAINMSKDPKCIELHGAKTVLDEDLIVAAQGGIKNAFVRIQRGAPKQDYPMPKQPAVLDQKDCMFHPRVQGIRVGQELLVKNDDPVTHNVRSFPVLNPAFNFGQPPKTDPRVRVFERAEREIEIQCDFHLWMHAYVFVMDHPFYAVSDENGAFAIEDLPPGDYTLECWHEKLGKKRQNLKVGDADMTAVNFAYPN